MEGGVQKIALFADDVLIYLSKLTTSLMSTRKDFGPLSGDKLNGRKTHFYLYTPDQKFNWDSKSMKYLGVNVPQDFHISINYDPLCQQ